MVFCVLEHYDGEMSIQYCINMDVLKQHDINVYNTFISASNSKDKICQHDSYNDGYHSNDWNAIPGLLVKPPCKIDDMIEVFSDF